MSVHPELIATYRLQFHRGFTFADAQARVPYLKGLGISHLYASPITMAVPGSTHGYDVTDPTRINPELGGTEGFERLAARLAAHGMGVLLDIVPNHMAASSHNPFWMEMLEGGPEAPAARLFDVIWQRGRLVLPVLGQPLQAAIEAGELSLRLGEDGRILAAYADHLFPLRRETVADLTAAAGLDSTRHRDAQERAALEAALARADLAAVLEAQHWRLVWWRAGAHDLNYRRFFNITDLAGVRVEDPAAFDIVHRLPLDLVRRGLVHGLRIDHIDGLVDPAAYSARLREAVGEGVPIFVEKILEPGETLRPWPIDGTTGYERLNDINGLFVDAGGYRGLEEALRERHILVGALPARLAAAKRQVLETSLRAEVDLLSALARDGLDDAMATGDLTEAAIRAAVIALLVQCPVYRSYATATGHGDDDIAVWHAIRAAVEANEDPLTAAAAALLLDRLEHPERPSDLEFRVRFQQLSGPAMAKGFEDTELYRVPILLCVNEVGGSLEHPARTAAELHDIAGERARTGTRDLIPLATHDTKRGPAARARLAALSFAPQTWLRFTDETMPQLDAFARLSDGVSMPDPLDRHLILQTLLSVWPIATGRMEGFLTKALREAKRHTSWETPNEAYEQASLAFARTLIETPEASAFRDRLERLVASLAPAARIVGLAQLVLQHTLPGIPDLYQGTEFPDFSLVDPDNRRPIDWQARADALAGAALLDAQNTDYFDLTRRLLALRRRNGALSRGDYRPLALPPSPWEWFGFERRHGAHAVRVIVPSRLPPDMAATAPAIELAESLQRGWRTIEGRDVTAGTRCLAVSADWPFFMAEAQEANCAAS
jgi:(1->4)-alpha-D-glucan 1-alpha-D-glucosylmutase